MRNARLAGLKPKFDVKAEAAFAVWLEPAQERADGAKYDVVERVRVLDIEELGREHLVPSGHNDEVQVCGPHWVAPLRCQQLTAWTIDRDGVAGGAHALEPKPAFGVGLEPAAQVHVGLLGVLVLVQTHG